MLSSRGEAVGLDFRCQVEVGRVGQQQNFVVLV